MAIRTVKPTSPSLRYLTYVTYDDITKTEPEKGLLIPKRRTNGRNVYGRITVRHRGGGAKQMIRQVDFRREKYGIPARVAAIEYDPNRSARIALLHYLDGAKSNAKRIKQAEQAKKTLKRPPDIKQVGNLPSQTDTQIPPQAQQAPIDPGTPVKRRMRRSSACVISS